MVRIGVLSLFVFAGGLVLSSSISDASNNKDADRRAILRLEQQWLDCHDSAVSFYGNTSVVRTLIGESDKNRVILSRRIATDVFVKREGRWQAISTQDNVISSK